MDEINKLKDSSQPLFAKGQPVSLTLLFYMARPLYHFVGGKEANRDAGNIKFKHVDSAAVLCRADLDNLTKTVLDAGNGILYHDDVQVVKITAMKMCDTTEFEDFYNGHAAL